MYIVLNHSVTKVSTLCFREGNAYFLSKYPLFDGIGDAYFKGYT